MTKDTFAFVVYMIHACAARWRRLPTEVYRELRAAGCIDGYLVPHYEVLHTMGTDSVVDDIETYLKTRGVTA